MQLDRVSMRSWGPLAEWLGLNVNICYATLQQLSKEATLKWILESSAGRRRVRKFADERRPVGGKSASTYRVGSALLWLRKSRRRRYEWGGFPVELLEKRSGEVKEWQPMRVGGGSYACLYGPRHTSSVIFCVFILEQQPAEASLTPYT